MQRIVECVPNFSEGRNQEVIEAISQAVRDTAGATLLYVDSDADYNRTVFTFVGEPEAVVEAAFNATKVGTELIDMSAHKGGHPRMGAADVVPFVPVAGVTMEECAACAEAYGKRIAEELSIPVYLYERAAKKPERQNLAVVRRGEYEALPEKMQDPEFAPDFGKTEFNAKSGATATGARPFLIAYNVSLKSEDVKIANKIAGALRESGVIAKDEDGNKIMGENGKAKRIPGRLKALKGMGVEMPKYKITQVSMNLTDFHLTAPHVAFQEVKKEAAKYGVEVSGSEVVGLIPKEALIMAGKYYKNDAASDEELVKAGIEGLGLSDLYEFKAEEKVIEYLI